MTGGVVEFLKREPRASVKVARGSVLFFEFI